MIEFDEWHFKIKIAFQSLVKLIGTNESSGAICSVSGTSIHRYGDISPQNSDQLPPLRIVLLLEAASGQPVVTSVMAERTGHRIAAGDGRETSDCMIEAHADITADFAKATASIAEAMQDKKFSPNERKEILGHYASMIASISRAQGTSARLHAVDDIRRRA